MTKDELQLLIDAIYNHFKVIENPEITLEANPDDLTPEKILDLSKSVVNRLSIGVQSFFEDDLKMMNRAHSSNEAKACLSLATQHFDNITIDLIYGIPNMSLEKWDQNLEMTFDFGINHISSYALTVEPKTALDSFIKQGKYPSLDETLALQHFNHLVERTQNKGFVQYEISNFGKPSFFSKHNTSYWQGTWYLGIGPSAHSFVGNQRSWNVANNTKYIKAIQNNELPNTVETLSGKDMFNEYLMTGLRTMWGVSLDKVRKDFGMEYLQYLVKSSEKYIERGLVVIENKTKQSSHEIEITSAENTYEDNILKIAQKGKFLVDGIASELFMI